jgi:hypothetical protein
MRGDHGYKERFRAEVRSDVRRRVARVNAGLARSVAVHAGRVAVGRVRGRVGALRRGPVAEG